MKNVNILLIKVLNVFTSDSIRNIIKNIERNSESPVF